MGLLLGLIVLVFVAMLFSLLVDKRFSFSKERVSLSRLIEEEKHELQVSRKRLEEASRHWTSNCEPLLGQDRSFAKVAAEIGASEKRIKELQERRRELAAEVQAATDKFANYRSRYRLQVRSEATGESAPELRSRSGRIYRNIVIRAVSAAGMEIRHDEGNSRLSPEELDPSWRERFQWDGSETADHLAEERERARQHHQFVEKGNSKPPLPLQRKAKNRSGKKRAPADEEVEELRQALMDARRKLNEVEGEAIQARAAERSSRGRSVPGSLETWGERAARFEASGVKLRAQSMRARQRLAAVAPGDALLQIRD